MNNSTQILLSILFLVVSLATGYWFYNNFAWIEEEKEVGFQGIAKTNKLLAGEFFLRGWFRLQRGDVNKAQQKIRQLLEHRSQTQPTTQPSCGSTFRNPEGDYAARLIEAAGLKGYCIGGACVSEKHANFIINRGDATATDIEQLMGYVQQQVFRQSSISLQAEVHIVGEAA